MNLRAFINAFRSMPEYPPDRPITFYMGGRVCHWPHCECPSAKGGEAMDKDCRGLKSDSPYYYKCKRIRVNGPTPCFCCEGECCGEPRDAAHFKELCDDFEQRMARRGSTHT